MRAADARDRALVAEERMELVPLPAQDRTELARPEAERVGSEMRELVLEPLRA